MHVNEQIRAEFETRILGVSAIGSAHTNRGPNLTDADLPAAIIQTPSDEVSIQSKPTSTTRQLERREIEVVVVVVADGDSETLDDDLDDLRASIEVAVGADDDLGGIAHEVIHNGIELDMGTDDEGARWYAFLSLMWNVEVWTYKGDPETAI